MNTRTAEAEVSMTPTGDPAPSFNLADLFEQVAGEVPDRIAIVVGERRVTYRELDERSNRLAHHLVSIGLRPGDTVGIDSYNRVEWVEAMLGAYKARAVPVNLNYRYVGAELRHVLDDADVSVLVFERGLSPVVEEIRDQLPRLRELLVLEDGSAEPVDADGYDTVLAASSPDQLRLQRSSDDLYLIYTGGTTGLPKGVMWRHEDLFYAALGGGAPFVGEPITQPQEIALRILPEEALLVGMVTTPIMHAAAQWSVLLMLLAGGRVLLSDSRGFDPHAVWSLVERERANLVVCVGDAVARPLAEALAEPGRSYDLSSMVGILSGGAVFSAAVREQLQQHLPQIFTRDTVGGSETGVSGSSAPDGERRFEVREGVNVLRDDLTPVEPGSGEVGWFARSGRIPLGYRNDPAKNAATYPTDANGVRWSIPGDYATVENDGTITLLGRGSSCINTGGEKVYPEEVEAALKRHPDVFDVVVVGIPDERFGQRIAAVVHSRAATLTLEDLQSHAREYVAGYKVPRHLRLVDAVQRTAAGKPDYEWAKGILET